MGLTREFKEKTKNSNLRCHLAVLYNVSYFTICRWLEDENDNGKITNVKYLPELLRLTNLKSEDIFE